MGETERKTHFAAGALKTWTRARDDGLDRKACNHYYCAAKVTTDPREVTCKNCLRAIKAHGVKNRYETRHLEPSPIERMIMDHIQDLPGYVHAVIDGTVWYIEQSEYERFLEQGINADPVEATKVSIGVTTQQLGIGTV